MRKCNVCNKTKPNLFFKKKKKSGDFIQKDVDKRDSLPYKTYLLLDTEGEKKTKNRDKGKDKDRSNKDKKGKDKVTAILS